MNAAARIAVDTKKLNDALARFPRNAVDNSFGPARPQAANISTANRLRKSREPLPK